MPEVAPEIAKYKGEHENKRKRNEMTRWVPDWSEASPGSGDAIIIATGSAVVKFAGAWFQAAKDCCHDNARPGTPIAAGWPPVMIGYFEGRPVHVACAGDAAIPEGDLVPLRDIMLRENDDIATMLSTACQVLHWQRDHQFCGRCGAATRHHEKERARWCPVCSIPFYPRIAPCIIVQIIDGDRVLLARSSRHKHNFYSLIAGFIEAGESAEAAVAREIREETGLEVRNIRYAESQPWPFPHQLMLGFFADLAGGELKLQADELASAGWFGASDLPPVPSVSTIAGRLIQKALAGETSAPS